jgi:hypothetical protein
MDRHWLRPQLRRIRLPPIGKPCIFSIARSASALRTNCTKPQCFPTGTFTYNSQGNISKEIVRAKQGKTHIVDITKGCKERFQSFLGNQGGQATDENRRIIRVRGRELLAVWSDEIAQDRARLCLVLPGLFYKRIPCLLRACILPSKRCSYGRWSI